MCSARTHILDPHDEHMNEFSFSFNVWSLGVKRVFISQRIYFPNFEIDENLNLN